MAEAVKKKKERLSLRFPFVQKGVRYGEVDVPFFLTVLALLVMGIIMMFSASYAWAIAEGHDGTYYAIEQIKTGVIGLILMYVLSVKGLYQGRHRIARFLQSCNWESPRQQFV